MTIFFYILISLAIFHFIYDGIFVQSLRLNLRYRLLSLQDNLHDLKIENEAIVNDTVHKTLQSEINHLLKYMHHITPSMLIEAAKFLKNSPELIDNIEKRRKIILECPVKEIQEIYYKLGMNAGKSLIFNSGGWLIYLVPIIILLLSFQKIKYLLRNFAILSEKELKDLFHLDGYTA